MQLQGKPAGIASAIATDLPALQVHPLPPSLAAWQDPTNSGDYLAQLKPVEVGALVWSQFPVKVYIESPSAVAIGAMTPATVNQLEAAKWQAWVDAVSLAVAEWNEYMPLQVVAQPEEADITIWRATPRLQVNRQSSEPQPWDRNYRARSAETRYELYIQRSEQHPPLLAHRCAIALRPSQTSQYIQAAARHELGHALGIWGHSSLQTDALFFSQVRQPAGISARDVNTLKRVYQQPTRLGWPVEPTS